ncbi:MAG: 50S ribosomal protein L6 [Candidatus Nanoarchaeia archaeon]
MLADIIQKIAIPEGVTVEVVDGVVKVKGPKGENQRTLAHRNVKIQVEDRNVVLSAKKPTKREKTMIGTFKAHVKNMIRGVLEGYTYKLKICSSHFPITVNVEGDGVVIKNFLGEKIPRRCKIPKNVSVKVEGSTITLESVDIEKAGKAASLIEQATRITNRDRRIFQDGIYITEKPGR